MNMVFGSEHACHWKAHYIFFSVCLEVQMEQFAFGLWANNDVSQVTESTVKVCGHYALMKTSLDSIQVAEIKMLCGQTWAWMIHLLFCLLKMLRS